MSNGAPSLFERLYQRAARVHGGLYRRGVLRRSSLDRFTVSVGALRFGGAGKTPLVQELAGSDDAVLIRGYGGEVGAEPRVATGEGDDGPPWQRALRVGDEVKPAREWSRELGDEATLLAAALPGIPVGVCPDRRAAATAILARHAPRRFLLDDGFSHHRLRRDADLVVVPVEEDRGRLYPIPGHHREPWSALDRADALVLLSGENAPPRDGVFEALVEALAYGGVTALVRREVTALWGFQGGERVPTDTLRGCRVATVCAVGRPRSVSQIATGPLGARVAAEHAFRDHKRFTADDLARVENACIDAGATAVVSTLKDAVRVPLDWTPSLPWWIVEASLTWDRGQSALEEVVAPP